jgi:hypothetical protein
MYDPPEHPPASLVELGDRHPEMTVSELFAAFYEGVGIWVLWGIECAPDATPEQRQNIIRAILLNETNGALGALGTRREARSTEAHQRSCNIMSGEELAHHCHRLIDETIADEKEQAAMWQQLKSKRGPKAGETGFTKADKASISEIKSLIPGLGSARAACFALVDQGKVSGRGNRDSKADRLYRNFLRYGQE